MLGHYSGFILAAYGVTTATVAFLIIWVISDGRTQAKTLAQLNERGIHRRSDRTKQTPTS